MLVFKNILWTKRIIILISLVIVSFILWNTFVFFQKFKTDERTKMEIYGSAIKEMTLNPDLNVNFNLVTKVYSSVKGIPSILTDANGNILSFNNLDKIKSLDKKYLANQLRIMKKQNIPIEISYKNEILKQYVYYRNSDVLIKLTYYPIYLLIILALFLIIIYFFYSSNKIAEQNKLWTGMAKETAHQIGTPLSSLMGWVTILSSENVNAQYIDEINKDINRLDTIIKRFSKIGSLPELNKHNIVTVTKNAVNYIKNRSSKQVKFYFFSTNDKIITNLNIQLYSWVIENLIKNSIDAMQGKGIIKINLLETISHVKITVSDTGKGIKRSNFKHIFKPGYTSKKRGWGLGLSLSKRIIENYHNGKIVVEKSKLNKGTTFFISLNKK